MRKTSYRAETRVCAFVMRVGFRAAEKYRLQLYRELEREFKWF